MAEVDTSIYNNLQAPNPMNNMLGAAHVMNALNQNRLFQQQQQAGQIFGQHIGPDGTVSDIGQMAKALGGNPLTGQMVQQALELKGKQTQVSAEQMQLHSMAALRHVDEALASPDLDDPVKSPDVMKKVAVDLMADPATRDSVELHQVLEGLDQIKNNTPQQNRQFLLSRGAMLGSVIGKAENYMQNPQYQNVGGQQVPVSLNPRTNPNPPVLQNTLPATTPQFNQQTQQTTYVGGTGTPGGSPGTVAATPPIGVENAANVRATANNQRFQQNIDTGTQAMRNMNVLRNIVDLSKKGVASGTGQDWQNNVVGMVKNTPELGQLASSMGLTPDNYTDAAQVMKKFMAMNAVGAWGGAPTDQAKSEIEAMNPSMSQFPKAVQKNASYLMGMRMYEAAKANEQSKWAGSQPNRNTAIANQDEFEDQWRKKADPEMFEFATMSPAERKDFLASKKGGKSAFLEKMSEAIKGGWVPSPVNNGQ